MVRRLRYGNTNTFLISGGKGSLLVDTDYAGTLPSFYRAIGAQDIKVGDIDYVLATHYHPDHIGLIGELQRQGVKLLVIDLQLPHLHFSDRIFERERQRSYLPPDESTAEVISFAQSRAFLEELGICGEIISTPSHSADSVSLILDSGDCFVGDLEPASYTEAYGEGSSLSEDWMLIMDHGPRVIHYSHRPDTVI